MNSIVQQSLQVEKKTEYINVITRQEHSLSPRDKIPPQYSGSSRDTVKHSGCLRDSGHRRTMGLSIQFIKKENSLLPILQLSSSGPVEHKGRPLTFLLLSLLCQTKQNKKPCTHTRDNLVAKSTNCFSEDQGSIPSSRVVAQNHL